MANGKKKGVREIAAALGCTPTYVSEVLNGRKDANSDLAKSIKAAYKMLPKAKSKLKKQLKKAK